MANGKEAAKELVQSAGRMAGRSDGESAKHKLRLKQQHFCELYASDREFFGNGTQSYAEAYGLDLSDKRDYATARAGASESLTRPDVLAYIDELLDFDGFNDQAVDKELKFVIAQKADLGAKVSGIREYNKLKARITEKTEALLTADVTSNGETIGNMDSLTAGFAAYLKAPDAADSSTSEGA